MIRINQIKISSSQSYDELIYKKVCKLLRVHKDDVKEIKIVKKSIDSRKKPDIFYSYIVDVSFTKDIEAQVYKRCQSNKDISIANDVTYHFPFRAPNKKIPHPIIVGTGPAGLFCGYMLAKYGYKPILVERGEAVEQRMDTVHQFWNDGVLNQESNVQFGEGGAGTFSDGKLNTLNKDKFGMNKEVLRIFVENGASESILYENKPHIGTDLLVTIVKNMRAYILSKGGTFLFEHKMTDILIEDGKIVGIECNDSKVIHTSILVLAIGHSARDTFQLLQQKHIPMSAKSFAIGLRVIHPQSFINESQYGVKELDGLPVADYKLTGNSANHRGVYSFCMCPGGFVVNASSEEHRLTVNGMSNSQRESTNANSAIIVSVTPSDFPTDDPLSGILFQRNLEERAFQIGNGLIPIQTYGAFKKALGYELNDTKKEQKEIDAYFTDFSPCIKGAFLEAPVHEILPDYINKSFVEGMEQFDKKIPGFSHPKTIIAGVESRTSSPIRMERDEQMQSAFQGLFPCGEGAGYSGGITSAAMDGIKIAQAVARNYENAK